MFDPSSVLDPEVLKYEEAVQYEYALSRPLLGSSIDDFVASGCSRVVGDKMRLIVVHIPNESGLVNFRISPHDEHRYERLCNEVAEVLGRGTGKRIILKHVSGVKLKKLKLCDLRNLGRDAVKILEHDEKPLYDIQPRVVEVYKPEAETAQSQADAVDEEKQRADDLQAWTRAFTRVLAKSLVEGIRAGGRKVVYQPGFLQAAVTSALEHSSSYANTSVRDRDTPHFYFMSNCGVPDLGREESAMVSTLASGLPSYLRTRGNKVRVNMKKLRQKAKKEDYSHMLTPSDSEEYDQEESRMQHALFMLKLTERVHNFHRQQQQPPPPQLSMQQQASLRRAYKPLVTGDTTTTSSSGSSGDEYSSDGEGSNSESEDEMSTTIGAKRREGKLGKHFRGLHTLSQQSKGMYYERDVNTVKRHPIGSDYAFDDAGEDGRTGISLRDLARRGKKAVKKGVKAGRSGVRKAALEVFIRADPGVISRWRQQTRAGKNVRITIPSGSQYSALEYWVKQTGSSEFVDRVLKETSFPVYYYSITDDHPQKLKDLFTFVIGSEPRSAESFYNRVRHRVEDDKDPLFTTTVWDALLKLEKAPADSSLKRDYNVTLLFPPSGSITDTEFTTRMGGGAIALARDYVYLEGLEPKIDGDDKKCENEKLQQYLMNPDVKGRIEPNFNLYLLKFPLTLCAPKIREGLDNGCSAEEHLGVSLRDLARRGRSGIRKVAKDVLVRTDPNKVARWRQLTRAGKVVTLTAPSRRFSALEDWVLQTFSDNFVDRVLKRVSWADYAERVKTASAGSRASTITHITNINTLVATNGSATVWDVLIELEKAPADSPMKMSFQSTVLFPPVGSLVNMESDTEEERLNLAANYVYLSMGVPLIADTSKECENNKMRKYANDADIRARIEPYLSLILLKFPLGLCAPVIRYNMSDTTLIGCSCRKKHPELASSITQSIGCSCRAKHRNAVHYLIGDDREAHISAMSQLALEKKSAAVGHELKPSSAFSWISLLEKIKNRSAFWKLILYTGYVAILEARGKADAVNLVYAPSNDALENFYLQLCKTKEYRSRDLQNLNDVLHYIHEEGNAASDPILQHALAILDVHFRVTEPATGPLSEKEREPTTIFLGKDGEELASKSIQQDVNRIILVDSVFAPRMLESVFAQGAGSTSPATGPGLIGCCQSCHSGPKWLRSCTLPAFGTCRSCKHYSAPYIQDSRGKKLTQAESVTPWLELPKDDRDQPFIAACACRNKKRASPPATTVVADTIETHIGARYEEGDPRSSATKFMKLYDRYYPRAENRGSTLLVFAISNSAFDQKMEDAIKRGYEKDGESMLRTILGNYVCSYKGRGFQQRQPSQHCSQRGRVFNYDGRMIQGQSRGYKVQAVFTHPEDRNVTVIVHDAVHVNLPKKL